VAVHDGDTAAARVRSPAVERQSHFGKKPDGSAMHAPRAPVDVAILAFPETTASVTYGMYDLLVAAGRDWGIVSLTPAQYRKRFGSLRKAIARGA
jgi:hypothetical protein